MISQSRPPLRVPSSVIKWDGRVITAIPDLSGKIWKGIFGPSQPTLTVYSGYNKTNLKKSGYKVYTVKKELVELGRIFVIDQFGNSVPMYDMERTMCDLMRSRSHFEIQDFNTAIKSYVRRTDKDLGRLFEYAKQFGVEKLMRGYLEVLL